jgi:hypothetical protein
LERLVGRLCHQSQVFPEIGAHLHGGYRIAYVRARGGSRPILRVVSLSPGSDARAELLGLLTVATDALAESLGVAFAPSLSFPAPDDPGTLVVTSDASVDIDGGDAGPGGYSFHPAFPYSVFITFAPWPPDIALALAEAALPLAQRSGRLAPFHAGGGALRRPCVHGRGDRRHRTLAPCRPRRHRYWRLRPGLPGH